MLTYVPAALAPPPANFSVAVIGQPAATSLPIQFSYSLPNKAKPGVRLVITRMSGAPDLQTHIWALAGNRQGLSTAASPPDSIVPPLVSNGVCDLRMSP